MIPIPCPGLVELKYGDFILNLENKIHIIKLWVLFWLLAFMLISVSQQFQLKSFHVYNIQSVMYLTHTPS